jgi:hypothetical protein
MDMVAEMSRSNMHIRANPTSFWSNSYFKTLLTYGIFKLTEVKLWPAVAAPLLLRCITI